jgi:very-short-patch-repair endonuclease
MTKLLTSRAKQLRKDSTEAERKLWQKLKSKQLAGLKFRRQQPIGRYIVDFVSFEKRLVIELDGSQHASNNQKDHDRLRDGWLRGEGYRVLRFWNKQALDDIETIWEEIGSYCTPSPYPLPPREGR